MEQYFSQNPTSKHDLKECRYSFCDHQFTFITDSGVFSKGEVDRGSDILLHSLPSLHGDVLDMGCGYGLIGIVIKKCYPDCNVVSIDINQRAVNLTRQNALRNHVALECLQNDGLSSLGKSFDYALINPPIRAGKETVYRLFNEIRASLSRKGKLFIVIRTKQGAKSAVEYLKTLFHAVNTIEIKSGYRILECIEPR